MVGRDEAEIVLGADLIARIMVQTCRQSGLSAVYQELLDFGGDEIYFAQEPALVNHSFGDVLALYETSTIISIESPDGGTLLNPSKDRRVENGDKLIAVSEDDDTVKLSGHPAPVIEDSVLAAAFPDDAGPERTLILGWNGLASTIVRELDNYVPDGSYTLVVSDPALSNAVPNETGAPVASGLHGQVQPAGGIQHHNPSHDRPARPAGEEGTRSHDGESTDAVEAPRRFRLDFKPGDTTSRAVLDGLDIPSFDHVIVLSYSDRLDVQEADAKTLVTLLQLRDLESRSGGHFSIVREMLDIRNRELAESTHADDFIVSDQLVSLLMSQISENRSLAGVFEDLFDAGGSEIYLKPAERYVVLDRETDFYTVTEAARRRDEVAIGYKKVAQNGSLKATLVVNPDKSHRLTFREGDRVIVLSED
jgi:ion channel POLLUX/CASTOR